MNSALISSHAPPWPFRVIPFADRVHASELLCSSVSFASAIVSKISKVPPCRKSLKIHFYYGWSFKASATYNIDLCLTIGNACLRLQDGLHLRRARRPEIILMLGQR